MWLACRLAQFDAIILQCLCLDQIRIENTNLLPIGLLLCNKLQVPWSDLVQIVGLTTIENDIDRHLVTMVVDWPGQVFVESTHRKVNHPWMVAQIMLACLQQFLNLWLRIVAERKINHVGQLWHRCLSFVEKGKLRR